jgi:hypothetical protein
MWEQTQRIFLESVARVLHAVARITPGLLAMFLILGVTVVVALALRSGVRRLCERVGLDRRLRQWGVSPPVADGRTAPSRLIARLAALTVLALGFVAGLSAVDAATTTVLALRILDYMPYVLVAVAILAAGIAGSRAVERGVLLAAVNTGLPSPRLVGLAARWLTVILAVAIALENLGIGGRVVPIAFAILLGGFVLALALAVGLGAREAVERSLREHFPPTPRRLDDATEEDRIRHL